MKILKSFRLKNHYSCQDMANMLNISKSFYWQIENNKRKLSYEIAYKISKIFNTKPDVIFYAEYNEK